MKSLRSFFAALLIALSAAVFAPAAFAGDPEVDAAIASGAVGERADGYLGVVTSVSPAVERKVQDINNRRRALYEKLAAETGTTVAQVATITGEKQIAKASDGDMIMTPEGAWVRAGE
jgi:hypothetical protein